MKALNKFLIAFSVFAFSALAQAEGVSQEDIEAGNNTAFETLDL
ncbi:hypothetical protein [Marinobacter sp. F4206]|nr:hypothetical protein [Marinobacter sp. F4206]